MIEENVKETLKSEQEDLNLEIEETRRFMDFLQDTGREIQIEHDKRKRNCIHVMRDFAATATYNHQRKAEHLNALDVYYKPFRAHALKGCKRCMTSLEAIFSFIGHENEDLFTKINSPHTIALLDFEWEKGLENELYFCKMLKGFRTDEITYISSLPLNQALARLEKTRTTPLGITIKQRGIKKKTSYGGKGIPYFQLYLYTKGQEEKLEGDQRYTKICIRSRTKD